jgi:hypothetical protein
MQNKNGNRSPPEVSVAAELKKGPRYRCANCS